MYRRAYAERELELTKQAAAMETARKSTAGLNQLEIQQQQVKLDILEEENKTLQAKVPIEAPSWSLTGHC